MSDSDPEESIVEQSDATISEATILDQLGLETRCGKYFLIGAKDPLGIIQIFGGSKLILKAICAVREHRNLGAKNCCTCSVDAHVDYFGRLQCLLEWLKFGATENLSREEHCEESNALRVRLGMQPKQFVIR